MSALKVVKGIVKDARCATHTQTNTYGSGDLAQTRTTNTDYVELWIDLDGRDVLIRATSDMPFLAGHHATFIIRDGVVLFLRNDTVDRSHFIRQMLVRGESLILNASVVVFFGGILAFIPVAGGAPIAHIAVATMLCPFVAWAWSARARRKVKTDILRVLHAA